MMKRLITYLFIAFISILVFSQNKQPISPDVYDTWNSLHHDIISNNGKWFSYEINPQKGDGNLYVVESKSLFRDSFSRAYNAEFSPDNTFLVFKIKAQADSIRKAKLNKVEESNFPKDSLGIYLLKKNILRKIERVKSFKLPKKTGNWLCVFHEKPVPEYDSLGKPVSLKKVRGHAFQIINPITGDEFYYNNVCDYSISDEGNKIAFVSYFGNSYDSCKINIFDTKKKKRFTIFEDYGVASALTFDKKAEKLCFIHSSDSTCNKTYSLYYNNTSSGNTKMVIGSGYGNMPVNYSVSPYTKNWFSDDGRKLFFYIGKNPENTKKNTLLDEEKVSLDVWNWQDKLIQPEQLKNLKEDKKMKFLSVFNIEKNEFYQLCDSSMKYCKVPGKGNVKYAMGLSDDPYLKERSWDANFYRDAYLLNIETGKRELILKKQSMYVNISPQAKYLVWYNYEDNSWHTFNTDTKERTNISGTLPVSFTDENYDKPELPDIYGIAGWSKDDVYFLVYDRYDIWKMDPTGKKKAVRITHGREKHLSNHIVQLVDDQDYIDINKKIFLKVFNEETKAGGYDWLYAKSGKLKVLRYGDYFFYRPYKARDANIVIWSHMSFTQYPEVWTSDLNFTYVKKLSNTNPMQSKYLWGTVELVKWNLNGKELEGLLYKPENFNPDKKYPMIVYFYEKYSDKLHNYYSPKPSRSVINFTTYVSNGYFIFIPDIPYKEGHPGQSAVDAILSGTKEILKRPYIDKDRLGVQGHSWGGYQVAFLVTQTNMFKVAMAGAPVSNMTSSYGGIRWESGKSRMFQYEGGQSRIGASLWEKPELYIENSPLFFANKIKTPLLMMHNDNDGAVPWYQGIEMFLALRRLNKPVFMLNYNGEGHNLTRRSDQIDLTRRMQQYFDYYLKDAPIPEWMAKGIPAIEKGKNDGFNYIKE